MHTLIFTRLPLHLAFESSKRASPDSATILPTSNIRSLLSMRPTTHHRKVSNLILHYQPQAQVDLPTSETNKARNLPFPIGQSEAVLSGTGDFY